MTADHRGVGIIWRGDRDASGEPLDTNPRLRPVFAALADAGITAEPVLFAEETLEAARAQMLALGGLLIWVDPLTGGRDRSALDALLREVARAGVWVSAHPDVIMKMGAKEVVFRTKALGWGSDARLYSTLTDMRERLPALLASGSARVIKRNRGNGGIGVWQVERTSGEGAAMTVRAQDAEHRQASSEEMAFEEFVARCASFFDGGASVLDQPFEPRIADGMIRCYCSGAHVVGFATQSPDPAQPREHVLGLPSAKVMFPPGAPQFARLRTQMERDWISGMMRILGLASADLPALWDADFLYGPRDAAGNDTYILCEINASCVTPFPPEAPAAIARQVAERLR